jgi:hypothetical protein
MMVGPKEDELFDCGSTLTAVFLRPTDSGPTVRAHLLPDSSRLFADAVALAQFSHDLRCEEMFVVRAQFFTQRFLFDGVPDVH